MKTVGQVSELTGVTVRALHHYDEVGLLVPSERSPAGYRLYGNEDLMRLHEILGWRALGFPLAQIAVLIDDPREDRGLRLHRQRELVSREQERLAAVARSLDAVIEARENGTTLEEQTMFDGFDPAEYEDEARERWGHTDAYRESARRAAAYGEQEWRAIRIEAEEIVHDFIAAMQAGETAVGDGARAIAERHREHISRWFYPCSATMHRGLAELYVADPRFARTYETQAQGLAQYVHDAVLANASR